MPTSPKTAKEILENIPAFFAPGTEIFGRKDWPELVKKSDVLSAMRAAVEAVRPKEAKQLIRAIAPSVAEGMEIILEEFDANASRFFGDDPTPPPTPRN